MTREHTVAVKAKDGHGRVTHCAGAKYSLAVEPGQTATKWSDGSPITSADFEAVLAPTGLFVIAVQPAAKETAEKKGV